MTNCKLITLKSNNKMQISDDSGQDHTKVHILMERGTSYLAIGLATNKQSHCGPGMVIDL